MDGSACQSVHQPDQMVGDRLKAIHVAVGRNWFKRLASFIEHSSSNLGGGGERSGSLQEIREKLFINSVLTEQEIAKPRKINPSGDSAA